MAQCGTMGSIATKQNNLYGQIASKKKEKENKG
jgi:hypothetical protein